MREDVAKALRAAQRAHQRGRLEDARIEFKIAFDAARDAGDALAMGEAALGLGGIWVNDRRSADEYAEYRDCLNRALGAVGDDDPLLAARLKVRVAAETAYAENAPIDAVRDAVAEVRTFGEPNALAEALSLFHHLLVSPQYRAERDVVALELVDATTQAGDPMLTLLSQVWNTVDAFLVGDPEAVRELERLRLRGAQAEVTLIDYLVRTMDIMGLLRAGRLTEVEAILDDILALGVDVGEVDAMVWYGAHFVALRFFQGREHELLPIVRAMADSPEWTRFNRAYPALRATLAAQQGAFDEARAALAHVDAFGDTPAGLSTSSLWLFTMFAIAEAARHLGDVDLAEHTYAALEPFADLPIIVSLGVVCIGSTHRSLAHCAKVMGNRDLAIMHLRRAIDADVLFGNLPVLAITRAELAELLADDDPDAADALLDSAITSAAKFGMTGWRDRWTTQRAELEPTSLAPDRAGVWTRRGRTWEIGVNGTRVVVGDSIGMTMIATLLAAPHRDVSVTELSPGAEIDVVAAEDVTVLRDVLRLRQNPTTVADVVNGNADAGLGLNNVSHPERARTSVQKAIRRALERIGEEDSALADALRRSIRTGASCRFDPVDGMPVRWEISTGEPA